MSILLEIYKLLTNNPLCKTAKPVDFSTPHRISSTEIYYHYAQFPILSFVK